MQIKSVCIQDGQISSFSPISHFSDLKFSTPHICIKKKNHHKDFLGFWCKFLPRNRFFMSFWLIFTFVQVIPPNARCFHVAFSYSINFNANHHHHLHFCIHCLVGEQHHQTSEKCGFSQVAMFQLTCELGSSSLKCKPNGISPPSLIRMLWFYASTKALKMMFRLSLLTISAFIFLK